MKSFNPSIIEKPLISIVTVVFNAAETIEATIQSVVSQSYSEYEYIIIDGGSTDETVNIVKRYNDAITYWVSESDKGIYNAMNKGIEIAKGEFVTFLNGNDTYLCTTAVEQFVAEISDSDSVYFGNAIIAGEGSSWLIPPSNVGTKIDNWLKKYHPCHQTVFYPKKFYKAVHYNESMGSTADADFTLKAYEKHIFKHINVSLAKFSLGGESNDFLSFRKAQASYNSQINLRLLHRSRYPSSGDTFYFFKHWTKFLLFKIGGFKLQHLGMSVHKMLFWKSFSR
jgi:putative colanic acid biosynthesis glycosyltransferase